MIKFLMKTAVTLGIAGLALEGVKKIIEDKSAQDSADDDLPFEEEYVTLTRTESQAPAQEPAQEPYEVASEEKADEVAQDEAIAIAADMSAQQEEISKELQESVADPALEETVVAVEDESTLD